MSVWKLLRRWKQLIDVFAFSYLIPMQLLVHVTNTIATFIVCSTNIIPSVLGINRDSDTSLSVPIIAIKLRRSELAAPPPSRIPAIFCSGSSIPSLTRCVRVSMLECQMVWVWCMSMAPLPIWIVVIPAAPANSKTEKLKRERQRHRGKRGEGRNSARPNKKSHHIALQPGARIYIYI